MYVNKIVIYLVILSGLLASFSPHLGLELSFFSGVYGTGIGFTKRLGSDAAKYVGISGICIGVGEILGLTVLLFFVDKFTENRTNYAFLSNYII